DRRLRKDSAVVSVLFSHYLIHRVDDIGQSPDVLKTLDSKLLSSVRLELNNQIDGVDTINIQIFTQTSTWSDGICLNFKLFYQKITDTLENFFFCMGHKMQCCMGSSPSE